MDHIDTEARSKLMKKVRSKHTGPEITVRQALHRLGYRFRLHRRDLPGSPDVVFQKARKAIFVHGCFWHRHEGCSKATIPKTREEFWQRKFERNVERDADTLNRLNGLNWQVLIIWECETRQSESLEMRLKAFLR